MSVPCPITPARLLWLQHLAKHGETRWHHMPKRKGGSGGGCTNRTWRPMVESGFIEARFGARNFREPSDWLFKITDFGRAAIAKAEGAS